MEKALMKLIKTFPLYLSNLCGVVVSYSCVEQKVLISSPTYYLILWSFFLSFFFLSFFFGGGGVVVFYKYIPK